MILVERIILAASQPGDLVMDPFLGSGTTAIAAALLGRKCIGIESDDAHVALAQARLCEALQARVVQSEREVSCAGTGTSGK
jgi:DNA modification methylase